MPRLLAETLRRKMKIPGLLHCRSRRIPCVAKPSREPSERALRQAKKNVEQYYAVVGVTEDLGAFFRLLQYRFPRFFRGAERIYQHNGETLYYSRPKKPEIFLFTETHDLMNVLSVHVNYVSFNIFW